MKLHQLNQHVHLSEICFGGAAISGDGAGYGFGHINDNDAFELLHYAYDRGINFYDTAPIYGYGESERRIGKAFKKMRDDVYIISKCGVDWHENRRVNMTNDPKICQKMLERSMQYLEYIDIYMVHWPDSKIDIRYTLEILQKAKERKDIFHIGLCNTTNDDLEKAKEVCEIEIIQCEANLFKNSLQDIEFNGLKMNWGTFDKGILTGTVTKDRQFSKEDCRSWAPWWKKSKWKEKVQKVEKLKNLTKESEYSLVEYALGYVLKQSSSQVAICGFRNTEQLNSILEALNHLPDEELIDKARSILV